MTEFPPPPPTRPPGSSPHSPDAAAAGEGSGPDWPAPPGPGGRRRSRRGLVLAPVATAVAVAAVVAGVVAIRHDSSGASLRPLALTDETAATATTQYAATGDLPKAPNAIGAGYRVEGTLPVGPARGHVYTFPASQAPVDAVTKLAGALGLAGTPKRSASGWTVTAGGRTLLVQDGAGWRWMLTRGPAGGMACGVIVDGKSLCLPGRVLPGGGGKVIPIEPPDAQPRGGDNSAGTSSGSGSDTSAGSGSGSGGYAGSGATASSPVPSSGSGPIAVDPAPAAGSASGSAGSGGGGGAPNRPGPPIPGGHATAMPVPLPVDPVPVGPPPDEAAVRKAATDLLAALGLGAADIQVQSYSAIALVSAAPVVDGLPTSGYETRLQYDGKIALVGASGWLASPAAGAEYPLISAQRALDALPRPEIARACTDVEPSRCTVPLALITGARLGLALRHDQQVGALLVPAWLYTLRGSPAPLVVVAVDPAYLNPSKGGPGPAGPSPEPAATTVVPRTVPVPASTPPSPAATPTK